MRPRPSCPPRGERSLRPRSPQLKRQRRLADPTPYRLSNVLQITPIADPEWSPATPGSAATKASANPSTKSPANKASNKSFRDGRAVRLSGYGASSVRGSTSRSRDALSWARHPEHPLGERGAGWTNWITVVIFGVTSIPSPSSTAIVRLPKGNRDREGMRSQARGAVTQR